MKYSVTQVTRLQRSSQGAGYVLHIKGTNTFSECLLQLPVTIKRRPQVLQYLPPYSPLIV